VKIIDVNILLYAIQNDRPRHAKVLKWWEQNLNGDENIGLSWATLLGFVRISTNPRVFASPLTVAKALQHVHAWLAHANTQIVVESVDHWFRVNRY